MGHARTRDGAASAPAQKRSRSARLEVEYDSDHNTSHRLTPFAVPSPHAADAMQPNRRAVSSRPLEPTSETCAEHDVLPVGFPQIEHLIPQHDVSFASLPATSSSTGRISSASNSIPQSVGGTGSDVGHEDEQRDRPLGLPPSVPPDCKDEADASPLRDEIRAITLDPSLSAVDRDRSRQLLYLRAYRSKRTAQAAAFRARMHAERFTVTWSTHHDEITGERLHGCEHYPRKCKIRAACCGMWVGCRHCHNHPAVTVDHEIDRFATTEIMCMICWRIQPVRRTCINADCGAEFAKYFCERCKFYDGSPDKEIYHCDKCDICRIGKSAGKEFFHCDKCNACVSGTSGKDDHQCLKGSLDGNCPICSGCLRTSTKPVVFVRCGHALHARCFDEYIEHNYVCPLCSKTLTDMEPYYREIDDAVAAQEIPDGYRERKLEVLCHDCDRRSITAFHFLYHKCQECKGYNTRVIAERAGSEEVRVLKRQTAGESEATLENRDEESS